MSVFPEHIPENDRTGFALEIRNAQLLHPRCNLWVVAAGLAHPGQIALHVRHENGDATRTEILGQRLERYRLAGAGGAGDEAMPVCHFRQEVNGFSALGDENWLGHTFAVSRTPPACRDGTAAQLFHASC